MASVIREYNCKAESIFGDKKIGDLNGIGGKQREFPIYFGTELEYEVETPAHVESREDRDTVRAAVGLKIVPHIKTFAFTKHDGSLKNGFEVVTVPMTLPEHQKAWGGFFRVAKKAGLQARETCGMHVHVSRDMLSQLQIGKIMLFVFAAKNNKFIYSVGGRIPPKEYAEITPKSFSDVKRCSHGGAGKGGPRYSAVNITGGATIEFRFFASTLLECHALKNIEFCAALVQFTWPGVCGVREIKKDGVKAFCNYVAQKRKLYPNLTNFLVKEGYIKPDLKVPTNEEKKALSERKKGNKVSAKLKEILA
jgi:hypothetical protein